MQQKGGSYEEYITQKKMSFNEIAFTIIQRMQSGCEDLVLPPDKVGIIFIPNRFPCSTLLSRTLYKISARNNTTITQRFAIVSTLSF